MLKVWQYGELTVKPSKKCRKKITITMPEELHDHLTSICLNMSARNNKRYALSNLICEIMAANYPPPKNVQLEMKF